jgi:hypothetical protein
MEHLDYICEAKMINGPLRNGLGQSGSIIQSLHVMRYSPTLRGHSYGDMAWNQLSCSKTDPLCYPSQRIKHASCATALLHIILMHATTGLFSLRWSSLPGLSRGRLSLTEVVCLRFDQFSLPSPLNML